MRESESECRRELNPVKSACIEVFGTADAGTAIQICEASTVLDALMKNVVFYYDEAEDRIFIRTAAGAAPGGAPDSPPRDSVKQDARDPLKPSAAGGSGEKSVPKSNTARRTEGERGEGPPDTPKSPAPPES